MNFDPIEFLMTRDQVHSAADRQRERQIIDLHNRLKRAEQTATSHGSRISSLERWRATITSLRAYLPYLAPVVILIVLNAAPAELLDRVIRLLTAIGSLLSALGG